MAELNSFAEKKALQACNMDVFRQINLVGIKEHVERMLNLIGRHGIFEEYTKHNISHVDKMLQLLDIIITQPTREVMTDADWLLVVLSFYFHDLGMLVTKREFQDRLKNDNYIKYQSEYLKEKKNEISLHPLSPEEKERFIYQEYVRVNHGRRIADWLRNENRDQYDAEVLDIVTDMINGISALFINDLANICASHNEDDLDDIKKYPVKRGYGNLPSETGNIFYVSLLLRTADLLHITSDRTPTIEFRLLAPTNPVSQLEWIKQASVSSVSVKDKLDEEGNVDPSIQSDTLSITGYFKDYKGYFALMDYLTYARKELLRSCKLNEEIKKKYAIKYDFPWKYIDDDSIETKDFERRQLSFSIDQQKTLDLLVGETLYNNLTVSLRELAQNAIDAVRVKKYEESTNKNYLDFDPQVSVSWDPQSRKLTISDNGTGMNMDIIENYLLKVGSSRYQDEAFKKQHPHYNSISRFGIGLLTCFLVADNVDILTQMKDADKPLLLKISKLHGRYLLRHGVEEGSLLKLIGKTGTSIELIIRPEIDFNPEKILKDWIIIPNCSFSYHENGRSEKIGYENTRSYMEAALKKRGLNLEDNYKIETKNEEGVDFSILLKKDKYIKEWNFVEYSDIFDNQEVEESPCGLSIEGIRVDGNTPGFKTTYFVAMINLTGENAPQTNVARSSINSLTLDKALRVIYAKYLDVINAQKEDLSKRLSITWASSELLFLLNNLSRRDGSSKNILLNHKLFEKILQEQKYYLVETNVNRVFYSIEDLKAQEHFWSIDSAAYVSANNLLREINTSDKSAIELLKTLYGGKGLMLNDVDLVLSRNRYNEALDNLLLENFQVTDIKLFKDYRSMIIKWELAKENYWKRITIERDVNRHSRESLYFFLQESNKVNIQCDDYEGIMSDYGIFLFSNNQMHDYLIEIGTTLNKGIEIDMIVYRELCAFVHQCFVNTTATDNWENTIKNYFSQHYSSSFLREIQSKIDIKVLAEKCANSQFNLYDKSRWYRKIYS